MKEKVKKILVVAIFILFITGSFAPDLFAQTPIRKLGRGLANTFTGFLELPQNIVDAAEDDGSTAGGENASRCGRRFAPRATVTSWRTLDPRCGADSRRGAGSA